MNHFLLIRNTLLIFLALFVNSAQAVSFLPDTIAQGYINPNTTAQDLGTTSKRWDLWVANLNTPLAQGFVYIDSSGNLARFAFGTNLQYVRGDGVLATLPISEPPIAAGTTADYWRGDKSWQTLNTAAVPELTNLYWTPTRFDTRLATKTTDDVAQGATNKYYVASVARGDFSGTAPITYNSSTGAFGCAVANGSIAGCVSTADYAVWNAKQATIAASVAVSNQFVTGYDGAGSFTRAQPSFSNISGQSTNAQAPDMAQARVKGRAAGAGTGVQTDLTPAQLNAITGSEDIELTKAFAIDQTTDSSTGNIDTLTTTNISAVRLTGAAPVLRGIAGGANGKFLVVVNASGVSVAVKNADSNPTAANRILTGTSADLTLAVDASILLAYDSTSSRWRVVGGSGGGGTGSADGSTHTFTQSSHGFSVNKVVYWNGSAWALASAAADNGAAEALGIITAVTTNTFTLAMNGYVPSGLTVPAGLNYVSDVTAGAVSTTQPTAPGTVSKPFIFADSTSSGFILNMRGWVNTSSGSNGRGKFWTGYHDGSNCVWVQSPGSLSDFSDDGSCTFTQQLENGFTGKVVTYGASKPGLAITAPDTGYIKTCVSGDVMNGAANNIVQFDLYDGTNSRIGECNGNTSYWPFSLCIVTAVTAGNTYNVRLRGWAPSTGTIALLNGGRGALTWTVTYE